MRNNLLKLKNMYLIITAQIINLVMIIATTSREYIHLYAITNIMLLGLGGIIYEIKQKKSNNDKEDKVCDATKA